MAHPPLTTEEREALLDLARESVAAAAAGDAPPSLAPLERFPTLQEDRATFVTIRKGQALRGCIGTIFPHEPLAESIRHSARSASREDPRFPPVEPDEVADLDIEISVLTDLPSAAEIEDIELGRDGIVLRHGNAMALFLPQVAAEYGWDLEQTLSRLCQKARLPAEAWSTPEARFETFRADVFEGGH